METTTRKTTALQPPPFRARPTAGSSPDPGRPCLPDAPDWFNRARVRAKQRQSVALPPVPPTRSCSMPRGGFAGRWRIHNKAIALGMSLVALPIVFLMGFWTRGAVAPAPHDSVNSSKGKPTIQVAATRHRQNKETHRVVANVPRALPAADVATVSNGGMSNAERPDFVTLPGSASRRQPPMLSTIAANLDRDSQPFNEVLRVPAAEPKFSREPDRANPADGFALRSPVAGQFVADVLVPGNSWFSLAAATADCESGTCKLVPVKAADRKLNTALEWSTTPQLAAEQAAREGKLVFLIHVSGNFSQPGFT